MAEKTINLEIVDLEERIAPCALAACAAIGATVDVVAPPADVAADISIPVDTPNLGAAGVADLPPHAGGPREC